MPREVEQLGGEREHAPERGVAGIEAGFAQAVFGRQRAVPAAERARQAIHLVGRQAQRLRHVADRAAARVRGGDRGQRGALAAVAFVDVLDHFLAPGGVEVHVDVGRLLALARDESLHQHAHARGVHLGDPQHVADHRVRRRTAALAEDAAAAGEADDVVHGEEVGLVLQVGDQLQFVVDLSPHRVWRASGPAPARAFIAQRAQPARGGMAFGHHFARVVVAQLFEGEGAALGDAQGFGQQLGRIGLGEQLALAQVALAVGEQACAGLTHGAAVADGGDGVLQRAPAAGVHVHVAGGDQRQAERTAELAQLPKARGIIGAAVQFDRQPGAAREVRLDPGAMRGHRRIFRHPKRQHAVGIARQVGHGEPVLALAHAPAAERDPAAQALVASQRLRQQHQLRSALELQLGAGDHGDPGLARRFERPHHARHRGLVGDRQRPVTQRLRPREQLLRRTGPPQETEVRQAVQLGHKQTHRSCEPAVEQ